MYQVLKPLLFQLPAERAHHFTVRALHTVLRTPGIGHAFRAQYQVEHAALVRDLFGLRFTNPVGLAAGFDKDGKYYHDMAALGFGFLELGTVTPRPQIGNPQPRLFRLPKDKALINRMGFNNEGVDALVDRLQAKGRPGQAIIGGNIGKNKVTPNEEAVKDYSICFEKLFPWVDYFVVNVSSPNTPNLRALQDKEPLTRLLSELQSSNAKLGSQDRPLVSADQLSLGELLYTKPILLKIAPDLTDGQLDDILQIVEDTQIAGIIATNTTIARSPLITPKEQIKAIGNGGLSGAPVRERSTEVIRYLYERSGGSLNIIGVGGIDSAGAATEKLAAGAKLVQVYSGMIYAGPSLVKS
ncbi:MAG: quinone-dependent dihydroorotate dehydrogenase, partial [Bacteroidota bacterium]